MEGEKVFSILYNDLQILGEIDIQKYSQMVNLCELEEFLDAANMLLLSWRIKQKERFDGMFEKLNLYKEEIYDGSQVANFRSDGNFEEDEATIDKILRDEYGEDI